ncbi:SanA protein [Bisgaardia hudsonensis]|uniref:SanA protein n=1 Tax=Bisgaardia hudsonensis TaxID=109472 RepID=A0A4V2SJ25_9PAST|nr:ElyC/SanA/YdcF family protein [Bisgaardia hudsonensis]QLB13328.1 hypothetical protein A6A11_06775 [Bisgaardia hudsonensis]TCP12728.1 SanA protein [Bisgaardia hudsonensis]
MPQEEKKKSILAIIKLKTFSCLKKITYYFLGLVIVTILLLFIIDKSISFYVQDRVYENINTLPKRPYGVVLGTSKYFSDNTLNLYYYNRLLAAQELFKAKKVDFLLLSGDNRTIYYNEPMRMFKDLKKMNIPEEFMYMDFAGFRTLDSIIRADRIFKAHTMTIISQKFHCERAIFIAKYYDIDAICFVAELPPRTDFVKIRELFARMKAIIDLLTEKEPHFLGKPEPLPTPIAIPFD